jgi:hypothetical protein
MALTDGEKSDLRFFLGYSMLGDRPNDISKVYPHAYNTFLESNINHMRPEEETRVRNMLNDLRDQEQEIKAARSTLNIDTAGSFKKNKAELRARIEMFNVTRLQLGQFLQVVVLPWNNSIGFLGG